MCEGSGKGAHGAEQTVGLQGRQPGVAQNAAEMKSKVVGAIFHKNTLHFYFNFSEKFIYSCQYNTYFSVAVTYATRINVAKIKPIDFMLYKAISPLACQALLLSTAAPYQIKYTTITTKKITAKNPTVIIIYMPFIQGHAYFLVANTYLISAVFNDH